MRNILRLLAVPAIVAMAFSAHAQTYPKGLIDKTVAVVGNEMISLSDIEGEMQMQRAQNYTSDQSTRCSVLEDILSSKLFLMQARLDSLNINQDMVEENLNNRIDDIRTKLGGDENVEAYFGKPLFRLRSEWRRQLENLSLTQQEQGQIISKMPEITPNDIRNYMDTIDKADLPVIPIKYQLSEICIYPDRKAANMAVKEKLLALRERIINGEKFSTLARIYSEDPGSAMKGGELGMASKSIFWPAFSDAAMSLKPGMISQIVETPDGFHLIQVMKKNGDMFDARHILMKPRYTAEDKEKAFKMLDSLRTEIMNNAVTFQFAARFYSQDPATKTNGGQMADPSTGSAYFEIDKLKAQDYIAIKDLKEGEISKPVESLDNEGRTGNTVYKIIRVDRIIPAHTATFKEDYSNLMEEVEKQKREEAINNFIDNKIKVSYIAIDPIFKDCNFSRKGWTSKIVSPEE
jgi:peptidyl-prolyl cis-trans isomerase SurA